MNAKATDRLRRALQLLDLHYETFYAAADFAGETGHPVPCDTRGWSQILVSVLTGVRGLDREKGADLADGSDVKGANTWEAIDTPRFNGVIKAGTKAETSGKLESLDKVPYLFLVLWDVSPTTHRPRCRVWCVRPQRDKAFRRMCKTWYRKRDKREISSNNFQLHPPRGKDSNEIRNKCGNLLYPLLLCAERDEGGYKTIEYHPEVMERGECEPSTSS
jgi:hypothetical protein